VLTPEGFVLDIAGGLTVDRVGEIGAELFQVNLVDAAADFLVRGEQDPDRAVLDMRIAKHEQCRIHDFGDARLVVGAEQRGAVGGDDVAPDLIGERGVVCRTNDLCRIGGQHDIATAVVPHDLRLDIGAGAVGRGVHVGTEANDRDPLIGIGGDRRVDVAVLVEMGIGKPHLPKLACQKSAQIFLLFARGTGRGGGIGLGVDHHIAQKALGHGVREVQRRIRSHSRE